MTDHVYIAGPLFDEGERWWIERIDSVVAAAGRQTFLPHRDNPPKTADNVSEIFAMNRAALDNCSMVVASLNGVITDDGTAWEIGYAYALGRRIIGVHTDWRLRFPSEVVNLMVERSLTQLVRSLDELGELLARV
jgi:nucleoside 2-deoxyribosyltransferase